MENLTKFMTGYLDVKPEFVKSMVKGIYAKTRFP